jgi:hypothetical protein
MRIRTGLGILICCCAALAACTANASKGPDATVTTPAVGRPPAPASGGGALASEAFTPYAGLGASPGDGLAPGDTWAALDTACMNDAAYGQYAASAPFFAAAPRGLAFGGPYSQWGYIGTALAAQDGFLAPVPDPAQGGAPPGAPSMPAGAQAAEGKCYNIVSDFSNAQWGTSLAVIGTLNNDIGTDVVQDPELTKTQQAWSACMTRNGYDSVQPNTIWQQYPNSVHGGPPPGSSSGLSAAQNHAQIAAAVTDADCTLSTDLGGIYFAIQASYERQLVTANQQALNAAVREFKASYAKELSELPALLRKASPDFPTGPEPAKGSRPSPAHS